MYIVLVTVFGVSFSGTSQMLDRFTLSC